MFPNAAGLPSYIIFYEDMRDHPELVWQQFQDFLGVPQASLAQVAPNASQPDPQPHAGRYLRNLTSLLKELHSTNLGAQLRTAAGCTRYPPPPPPPDPAAAFAALCARFPQANMSWRRGFCLEGVAR
eukprot:CAMPEP_0113672426 /NCGR_PEP_ID=MMETSP0038_2-20120614/6262_1 /TAXON_ID=2898 /ORGANISM="Cryptomonas paramecium" /LENGTH=126 /DNA_ID=CAMNT_0000588705 /DNA_START=149 /DNA_END=525 /DNA_ORIENTATION=+ /assembly_acc=CAM_ASM_000170